MNYVKINSLVNGAKKNYGKVKNANIFYRRIVEYL